MRFIYNCRSREKNKDPTLSYQETEAAKKLLIRLSQEHHFGQEMKRVQKGLEMTKSSPLAAYRPLLKDGLLRVGGRLRKTGMQANHIHPLLLSRRAHLSKLIAMDVHRCNQHVGPATMQTILSGTYCILGAGQLAKSISRSCM